VSAVYCRVEVITSDQSLVLCVVVQRPITRPTEFGMSECDREASEMRSH